MTKQNKRLLVILIIIVVLAAALAAVLYTLNAPDKEQDKVVAEINGQEFTLGELTPYIQMSYENLTEYLGQDISLDTSMGDGSTVGDYILYDALTVLRTYRLIEEKAAQYGVELDPAQQIEYNAAIANYTGDRPEVFAYVTRCDMLYAGLYDYFYSRQGVELPSDREVLAWCEEKGVIRADYILLYYKDENGVLRTPKQMEELRALGDEILFLYATGTDFDTLEQQYSADGLVENTYMSTNDCHQEFLNAYYALSDGKISDVVEFEYGYFIIRRLAIDPDDILFAGQMTGQLFSEKITLWLSQQSYATTEAYGKLDSEMLGELLGL